MSTILSLTEIKDVIVAASVLNKKIDAGEISSDYAIPDFYFETVVTADGNAMNIMCDTKIKDFKELEIVEHCVGYVDASGFKEFEQMFNDHKSFGDLFAIKWNEACDGMKIKID